MATSLPEPRRQRLQLITAAAQCLAEGRSTTRVPQALREPLQRLLAAEARPAEHLAHDALHAQLAAALVNQCRDAVWLTERVELYLEDRRLAVWVHQSLEALLDRGQAGVSDALDVASRMVRCTRAGRLGYDYTARAIVLLQDAWDVLAAVRPLASRAVRPGDSTRNLPRLALQGSAQGQLGA